MVSHCRGPNGGCARSRLPGRNGNAIILWFFFPCLNKPVVYRILLKCQFAVERLYVSHGFLSDSILVLLMGYEVPSICQRR